MQAQRDGDFFGVLFHTVGRFLKHSIRAVAGLPACHKMNKAFCSLAWELRGAWEREVVGYWLLVR